MLRFLALLVVVMGAGTAARGQEPPAARVKAKLPPAFTPAREAAALAFVRAHHPELEDLLERLEPMKRAEYEKAIGELFGVSEMLAAMQERDPKRYEFALEAWKARSRVQLLAARTMGRPEKSSEHESALREALGALMEVERRQQLFELEQARARVKRLEDQVERFERERPELLNARYRTLLKRIQSGERVPRIGPKSETGKRAAADASRATTGGGPR